MALLSRPEQLQKLKEIELGGKEALAALKNPYWQKALIQTQEDVRKAMAIADTSNAVMCQDLIRTYQATIAVCSYIESIIRSGKKARFELQRLTAKEPKAKRRQ